MNTTAVMQEHICRLEHAVTDFEQYSNVRDLCTSLLASANDKLGDGICDDSQLDASRLHHRMEVLKACYVYFTISLIFY